MHRISYGNLLITKIFFFFSDDQLIDNDLVPNVTLSKMTEEGQWREREHNPL